MTTIQPLPTLSEQNYIQQLTIDCVIFGYRDRQLSVLVPKLRYKGDFWALPSWFVFQDEDIDEAAQRIIRSRTGIEENYLEQFQVTGKANRNGKAFLDQLIELNSELIGPNATISEGEGLREYEWFTRRFVSIGYYALVDMDRAIPRKSELDQSIEWYDIKQLPPMIMDHNAIVTKALKMLRLTLDQELNVLNLLPETFTMKEVQELYETILNKPFERGNFQKKILSLNGLERLEKKYTGAANKAPYLYRLPKPTFCEVS
ncbi:NUDIX hydrolase [Spirosoma sp. HMF4905]|uniref:NUDIX hydrolase n=1 Tax=Spirosoma arboris TaxID=2682092 RepID=A0A7K1SAY5_9BACT|nr:NUDIX hydrolase [Spirosoma arboris]MVM30940.1 NUDIX hydrolase [Spirosoma arboris]